MRDIKAIRGDFFAHGVPFELLDEFKESILRESFPDHSVDANKTIKPAQAAPREEDVRLIESALEYAIPEASKPAWAALSRLRAQLAEAKDENAALVRSAKAFRDKAENMTKQAERFRAQLIEERAKQEGKALVIAVERYADNGMRSHWDMIERSTGKLLASYPLDDEIPAPDATPRNGLCPGCPDPDCLGSARPDLCDKAPDATALREALEDIPYIDRAEAEERNIDAPSYNCAVDDIRDTFRALLRSEPREETLEGDPDNEDMYPDGEPEARGEEPR